jgi:DNA replication protein DnaC
MATREFTNFQEALAAHLKENSALSRLEKEAQRLGIKANEQPRVQCTTCCDKGVVSYEVPADDARFGKLFPCPNPACPTNNARIAARIKDHQAKLLDRAQIPPLYANFTFASWEAAAEHRSENDNRALDWGKMWVDAPGHYVEMPGEYLDGGANVSRNGLIFAGDYGVGKTGLMIAMAHAVMERGEQPLYIRAMDYFDVKYRTYSNSYRDDTDDRERDRQAVETVIKAPILMLDDFNLSNGTANKQDVMEELIRYRHNHMLPTVITCNETISQLERLWGKRSLSALLEVSHYIPMGGVPLRDTRQVDGAR